MLLTVLLVKKNFKLILLLVVKAFGDRRHGIRICQVTLLMTYDKNHSISSKPVSYVVNLIFCV